MLIRKLLKTPTDRDRQRRIGPSQAGLLCQQCVADGFLHKENPMGRYWLGGRVGTSIHMFLESVAHELFGDSAIIEKKIDVFDVEGYGMITGTPDLIVLPNDGFVWPTENHELFDWKSTTREKMPFIRRAAETQEDDDEPAPLRQARYSLRGYINQGLFYGFGCHAAGYPVKTIHIQYVVRGGTGDADFFEVSFEYNHEKALELIARVQAIYDKAVGGERLPVHPDCYTHGV